MTNKTLFEPYIPGSLTLANRTVTAPLTRNRAGAGLVPSRFAADYYAQRASAGGAEGYTDYPAAIVSADV